MSGSIARKTIVAAARGWIGTPYVHQASAKGAGADCLGLLRGLYEELVGVAPEAPPPYTPDWNERFRAEEPLLAAARRRLAMRETLAIGAVAIFRIDPAGPARHCGIISAPDRFIHAYAGRAVIESWLNRWWTERLAGLFDFPGTEE